MDEKSIWIHLSHPCNGIDITHEAKHSLAGQGYIRLDKLRQIVGEWEQNNQRYFETFPQEPTP